MLSRVDGLRPTALMLPVDPSRVAAPQVPVHCRPKGTVLLEYLVDIAPFGRSSQTAAGRTMLQTQSME